jgi:hypothetical protein
MIVSYWWLEHQVDLGRRVRLAAAGDLGADRAVRHIMTEAEAVATPLGVGLPQPMEKRSVNLPTAAHAVQVLWGRMPCNARPMAPLWWRHGNDVRPSALADHSG